MPDKPIRWQETIDFMRGFSAGASGSPWSKDPLHFDWNYQKGYEEGQRSRAAAQENFETQISKPIPACLCQPSDKELRDHFNRSRGGR